MFKAIALLFLFSGCSITGFYYSARLSRRKALLLQYRDHLQKMQTEMGYFKEPLPKLLEKLYTGSNEPIDIFLRQCLLGLECGNDSVAEIWKNAVKSAYESEPLKEADCHVMCKCGSFIGQSDYQSQKGHFLLLEGELSEQIQDAINDCKRKGPLYTKAALSVGAVLAIALL